VGGTTRAGLLHWEPQKLVAAVDVLHNLDARGDVKPAWRQKLAEYLKQVSSEMVRRKATALILAVRILNIFQRDFAELLRTSAACNGIIAPSGALACRMFDAWVKHRTVYLGRRGPGFFKTSVRPKTKIVT
jgi:hypothetical protein